MVIILHEDWSVRLGENRLDQTLKHLAVMLCRATISSDHMLTDNIWKEHNVF